MVMRTGDPEIAREINKALVLDLLRKHDRVSRADIARSLALSKVTVSTIIAELITSHLVAETGMGESQENGGRKPILLSLDTTHAHVVGVDVGTTSTSVVLGDLKGKVQFSDREPTEGSHTVEKTASQVARLVARAIDESGEQKPASSPSGSAPRESSTGREGSSISPPISGGRTSPSATSSSRRPACESSWITARAP